MELIESLDGVEALWCTKDGQIYKSSGFAQYETQPAPPLNRPRQPSRHSKPLFSFLKKRNKRLSL